MLGAREAQREKFRGCSFRARPEPARRERCGPASVTENSVSGGKMEIEKKHCWRSIERPQGGDSAIRTRCGARQALKDTQERESLQAFSVSSRNPARRTRKPQTALRPRQRSIFHNHLVWRGFFAPETPFLLSDSSTDASDDP